MRWSRAAFWTVIVLKGFVLGRSYIVPPTGDPLRSSHARFCSSRLGLYVVALIRTTAPFEASRRLTHVCLLRLEWVGPFRTGLGCRGSAFEDKLVFCVLLGEDVRKADVIDSELEVLPMLHDSQGVGHDFEREVERAFELLTVANQHTVSIDASFARQLRRKHLDCGQVFIQ